MSARFTCRPIRPAPSMVKMHDPSKMDGRDVWRLAFIAKRFEKK
jgi:hypothetical protein